MKIVKVKVKINGSSVPVDKYFLHALSFKYFGAPYEEKEIRAETNKKLREIVGNIVTTNPQIIHRIILDDCLPENIQKSIEKIKEG